MGREIVARCNRSSSASVKRDVRRSGERQARWRISSEKALPIPVNRRGSVSEHLRV
jgi:hypothetical protein